MRKNKRMLALITFFALMVGIFTQYGTWIGASEGTDLSLGEETENAQGVDSQENASGAEHTENILQGDENTGESAEGEDPSEKDLLENALLTAVRPEGAGAVELLTTLSQPKPSDPNVNVELTSIQISNTPNWDAHPFDGTNWSPTGYFHRERSIAYRYAWNIDHSNIYKKGDYFLLPLSQPDIFNFANQTGDIKGKVAESDVEISLGTYEVIESSNVYGSGNLQYAKIILNETAVSATSIKDGYFQIIGTVLNGTENFKEFILYAPESKNFFVYSGEKVRKGGHNIGFYVREEVPGFKKYSYQQGGHIEWSIELNYDNYRKMFNTSRGPIVESKGLYIEDDIPRGTKFSRDSILLVPILNVPFGGSDEEKSGSERELGNPGLDNYIKGYENHFDGTRETDFPKSYGEAQKDKINKFSHDHLLREIIVSSSSESYEEFKRRVLAQKQAGIYVNPDGTEKLIIYIGDDPMDMTYYNFFNGDLNNHSAEHFEKYVDAHLNGGRTPAGGTSFVHYLNTTQVKEMKEIYGSSGPTQGHITALKLSYRTTISDTTKESGYYNSAVLWSGDVVKSSSETYSFFAKSGGGGNLNNKISLKKVWGSRDSRWNEDKKASGTAVTVKVIPVGRETQKRYEAAAKEVRLNKGNNWSAVVDNMVLIINSENLDYEIEEIVPSSADYKQKSIVQDPKKKEWTITNIKKDEIIGPASEIDVNVEMRDCKGVVTAPEQEVTLTLQRRLTGESDYKVVLDEVSSKPITKKVGGATGLATVSFKNLPKLADNGVDEYEYIVAQEPNPIKGYKKVEIISVKDNGSGNYNVSVKNCKIDLIDVNVTLHDCSNNPKVPDADVELILQRRLKNQTNFETVNAEGSTDPLKQRIERGSNNSSISFTNLPKTDISGDEYEYTVIQNPNPLQGYKDAEIRFAQNPANGNFDVTVKNCKIELINAEVDFLNCDGQKQSPDQSIRINLKRKLATDPDTEDSWKSVAIETISANSDQSKIFNNLLKTNSKNVQYEYKVVQETDLTNFGYSVPEYGKSIETNGNYKFSIKNCKIPTIEFKLEFEDCEEKLKVPSMDVTVKLQRKVPGSKFEDVLDVNSKPVTKTIKATDTNTSLVFERLTKTDKVTSKDYVYRAVIETPLDSYQVLEKDTVIETTGNQSMKVQLCKNIDVKVKLLDCEKNANVPEVGSKLTLQRRVEEGKFEVVKDISGLPLTKIVTETDSPLVEFKNLPKLNLLTKEKYEYAVVQDSLGDAYTTVNKGIATSKNDFMIDVINCKKIDVRIMVVDCKDKLAAPPVNMKFTLQVKLENQGDNDFVNVSKGTTTLEETILSTTPIPTILFANLPKLDPDSGFKYVYRAVYTPSTVPGYTIASTGNATADNRYNMTVKICKGDFINVNVVKKWTGAYETPTKEVEFTLQRKRASETEFKDVLNVSGYPTKAKILQGASEQTVKFVALPKYDYSVKKSDGTYELYIYRVVETPIAQYSTTYDVKTDADGNYSIIVTNDRPNAIGGTGDHSGGTPSDTGSNSGGTSSDTGSNSGSGTQSNVTRITKDDLKKNSSDHSGTNKENPSDVAGESKTKTPEETDKKIIAGTEAGKINTEVLPGAIPKQVVPTPSVAPGQTKKLPKTGEGLNTDVYAMILAFLGISLVGFGVYRKKKSR